MKLWPLDFKKIKKLGGGNTGLSFSEENITVWVVSFLILIFLGVIAFDARLFYQTVVDKKTNAPPAAPAPTPPDKELEGIIKVLDERETKFKNILSEGEESTTSPRGISPR